MKNKLFLLMLTAFLFFTYLYISHYPIKQQGVSPTPTASVLSSAVSVTPTPQYIIGNRTKTAGCVAEGAIPDKACTPGAVLTGATKEAICVPGYSKSVRNVPESEKRQVYEEYGILSHTAGEYEVDHYISLELGGSNDIANLWPEAAEPRPGFHEKDKVENYLHDAVCNGTMTLTQAQQQIADNWLKVYETIAK